MEAAWAKSGETAAADPLATQHIADEIIQNPERGVTDAESALLLRHKVALGKAVRDAAQKVNDGDVAAKPEFDRLNEQYRILLDAIKSRGSEWGREGRWRQALAAEDYSFATREQVLRAKKGGEDTTELEQIVEQQKTRLAEKDKQLAEAAAKAAFDRIALEAKQQPAVEPHIRIIADKVKGYFDKRAESVLAEINSGSLNADPFGAKVIVKLADLGVSKILSGAASFVKWADEMRASLPEKYHSILPDIWEASQKALNDYLGTKFNPKNRDKIKKAIEIATDESADAPMRVSR